MLNIFNIRYGFACNSSSTHSFIFLNENENVKDENIESGHYSWDFFTCKSSKEKEKYFVQQYWDSLQKFFKFKFSEKTNVEWFERVQFLQNKSKEVLNKLGYTPNEDGYVDHQSCLLFPVDYKEEGLEHRFFLELMRFVKENERFLVLGGNDNDDKSHHLRNKGEEFEFPLPVDSDYNYRFPVAVHDGKYKFWTLFDKLTGDKVRFSFDEFQKEPEFSKNPELVDLKITDFCPFDCAFCYMSSTKKGKHANFQTIEEIVQNLSNLKVLELAIGGGEPTLHPQFFEILRMIRDHNIVPNFTTRNLKFLDKHFDDLNGLVGGIAVSIDTVEDMKKAVQVLGTNFCDNPYQSYDSDKIYAQFQYVMGSQPYPEFLKIMEYVTKNKFRMVLLGYKDVGFGENYQKFEYSNWIKDCKKIMKDEKKTYFKLGVDTKLAHDFQNELEKEKISKKYYFTNEGKFSMYVDAVEKKCGKSSYCEEFEKFEDSKELKKIYRSWQNCNNKNVEFSNV